LNNPILKGRVCPYCSKETEYVDSAAVYSRSYGMIYLCRPCDAYVGVHKGTDKALGRLANKELREAKKAAHANFDSLWKRKMENGFSKSKARAKAYAWLSKEMNLEAGLTHIGMMDVNQCQQVIEICKAWNESKTNGRQALGMAGGGVR
jgi:hypothetical protein